MDGPALGTRIMRHNGAKGLYEHSISVGGDSLGDEYKRSNRHTKRMHTSQ